jgi:hypothetical protein
MNREAILATLVMGNESWIGYSLLALLLAYALVLWLAPSRAKALRDLARKHGFRFEPIVTRKEVGIEGTTFDLGLPAENCMRGMAAGRETIVFDKTMPIEPPPGPSSDTLTCERTVVGFRVAADAEIQNRSIVQPGDWHVEKLGEWVFLYNQTGLVKPRNMEAYVEEASRWFERAIESKS